MNILIADDHGVVRQGLRNFIDKQADMEVVGEAEDGQTVVQLAKELSPDLIIMDISMPDMNGIEATDLILKENPHTKIVALSMHAEKHFVKKMLKAGAVAYVLKSYLFDEVLRAIRTVAINGYYLSPKITNLVVGDCIKSNAANISSDVKGLTERDLQIIRFLAEGKTTKQIALLLDISPKTADAVRRRIMDKLGISSIAELTKYALRRELTFLDS